METGMAWAEGPVPYPTSDKRSADQQNSASRTCSPCASTICCHVHKRSATRRCTSARARGSPSPYRATWRLIAREIVLDQAVIASHNLSVLF
ncbi:hypothetical protein ACLK12_13655 [Escherichia coli]